MPRILTNKFGFPEPLLRALSYDGYEKRGFISTTALIDSPKVRILRNNTEYYEDVSDLIWSVRGNAMHVVLERAAEMIDKFDKENGLLSPRYESEIKLDYKMLGKHLTPAETDDGIHLTGTFDLMHIASPVTLFDYKDTSVWKVIKCKKTIDERGATVYQAGPEDVKDWAKQTNIYRYIIWKTRGIIVEKINIIVFLKDWKQSEAYKEDYPAKPVIIVSIPIYNFESVERFIEKRLELHHGAQMLFEQSGIDAVPECTREERWATNETWKIYAYEGSARAISGGVYTIDSEEHKVKAQAHYDALKINNPKTFMKKFDGEDRRCENYCAMNIHCHYYKSKFR